MRRLVPVLLCATCLPAVAHGQDLSPLPGTVASEDPGVSTRATATTPSTPIGNPYGRAIDLTVNIQFYKRDLGETLLHLDRAGAVSFAASDFATALKKVLNEDGAAKVDQLLSGRLSATPDLFRGIGIDVQFDSENVTLSVVSIDPALRKLVSIYREGNRDADNVVDIAPEHFSAFVDVGLSQTRQWSGPRAGFRHPSIFLNSAARLGDFVLEAAGQFADRNPGAVDNSYGFDRNFVRLVYDIPKIFVRSYLGDLTPETRLQQNFVQMGGIGISRQRRRFDAFRSAILQGNRQLLLQRESTVDVYRNGILFQQLQLAPGAYDLGNLPLLSGSNDIRIAVKDGSGSTQTLTYQTYLDPIDLEPGDYEAGAYLGKLSTEFGLSPKYDGEVAFTGFYRKAFRNHPAIGVGLQLSKSVQQFSGQTQLLIGSGRLDTTGAVSRSRKGTGYFVGVSYDLAIDRSERATSLNVQGTWQNRYFTGLGAPDQDNVTKASLSAILSRTFSPRLSTQIGTTFTLNRKPTKNSYRLFADAYYQISRQWFVRGGVDYQKLGLATNQGRTEGFGFNVALIWRPSLVDRAEARYDYHFNNAQLSYEHSPDGYVGSVGYGGLLARGDGDVVAQGYGSYTGNRLTASISHSMTGSGFGNIADRQVTTARVSTAVVFAGGSVALTRRVNDSFAILVPHRSLRDHRVIVGQLLTDDRYRSRSGALGGAVNEGLGSYVTQSVQYDVQDPPIGYDVGNGVVRVRPTYHSGYRIVVGTDAYVTAMGVLSDRVTKAAVSLGSGELRNLSKPGEAAQQFFTNSIGRFAITGLRPGDRYSVRLSTGEQFEFAVPADNQGLIDLSNVPIDMRK